MEATPFTIAIPDERLADLDRRLRQTNWARDYANDDWRYGTNGEYLRELVDYWITSYDWRAQEAAMNAYDHFRVELDGVPIHFMHVRGQGPNPKPLLLTHGWPWTFWDFKDVIGPLTDPASHGGDPAESFDVVVPSLPGFGFSTPLDKTGINWWTTADLWARLMKEVLGYERFGAHGGDWGTFVTTQLGHKYAQDLIGIHVSGAFPLTSLANERPWSIGEAMMEAGRAAGNVDRAIEWEQRFASHIAVHTLDPQTLAFAMADSPVGMMSWILERRRAWSDCGGDVEKRFTKDHLITTICLYWLTDAFQSALRFYAETGWGQWQPSHERMPVIEAPTGISMFDYDTGPGTLDWMQGYYDLIFVERHSDGGHFAAAEAPETIVRDIRRTFAGRS